MPGPSLSSRSWWLCAWLEKEPFLIVKNDTERPKKKPMTIEITVFLDIETFILTCEYKYSKKYLDQTRCFLSITAKK